MSNALLIILPVIIKKHFLLPQRILLNGLPIIYKYAFADAPYVFNRILNSDSSVQGKIKLQINIALFSTNKKTEVTEELFF